MNFMPSGFKRFCSVYKKRSVVRKKVGIDLIGEIIPFGTIHCFVVENSSACTCFVSALAV